MTLIGIVVVLCVVGLILWAIGQIPSVIFPGAMGSFGAIRVR